MNQQPLPKISIVTACYNHAGFVKETIESVLSQNYPNLEYFVIDDGSTDGSWDVIKAYADRLDWCTQLDGYRDSPKHALNMGFEKSSGEILMWLNSDDVLLPNSLFTIGKIFRDAPDVEWLTGMATTINGTGEIVNSRLRLKHLYDFLVGDWSIIQQESTFFRRSLWERAGGSLEPNQTTWAFDSELWTRFFPLATHYHVNTPIGAFRSAQQSTTVNNPSVFVEPTNAYIRGLRARVSGRDRLYGHLYRLCRFLWPLLMFIPHRFFARIPLLKRFSYNVFAYQKQDGRWVLHKHNPFRRLVP